MRSSKVLWDVVKRGRFVEALSIWEGGHRMRDDDAGEGHSGEKRPAGKIRVSVTDEIAKNPKAARAFAALKEAGLTDQHARGEIARVMEYCMRPAAGKGPNLKARQARAEQGRRELDSMLERMAGGERARDILPPDAGTP
jgi:hypothetical protein